VSVAQLLSKNTLLICNSSITLSVECPNGVTITPSTGTFEVGDVLTCRADGYDPTYTWSGTAAGGTVTVAHTGSLYTLLEGEFDLICTAEVSQLTCTGTASASVVGDTTDVCTDGKYWIHLNILLTIYDVHETVSKLTCLLSVQCNAEHSAEYEITWCVLCLVSNVGLQDCEVICGPIFTKFGT